MMTIDRFKTNRICPVIAQLERVLVKYRTDFFLELLQEAYLVIFSFCVTFLLLLYDPRAATANASAANKI